MRADLGVGEAVAGEPGDVRLLGCELAARVVGALPRRLARGQELVTGALGERLGPDVGERVVGGSELLARVDAAVLATQPFAVEEPGAGEVDHATAGREPLDGLAVEGLRSRSLAEQRARAGLDAERPVGAARLRAFAQAVERRGGLVGPADATPASISSTRAQPYAMTSSCSQACCAAASASS